MAPPSGSASKKSQTRLARRKRKRLAKKQKTQLDDQPQQQQQQQKPPPQKERSQYQKPIADTFYSDEDLQTILEPFSKDQLVSFLLDAALADHSLVARIRSVADRDVSHRKIFVHGLPWDASRDDLLEAFSRFGPIEEYNVVVDKITSRSKGYGFVLFQTREGAEKALREPQKKIKSRMTACQLASVGPAPPGMSAPFSDTMGRKLYVSNVHADAPPDKLRDFFAKFGEIEMGPLGYDTKTGKSRGFALFVYKAQEGLVNALREPYKMFEGHQLHCQRASEPNKGKGMAVAAAPSAAPPAAPSASVIPSVSGAGLLAAASQPMLAAIAAAQNLALVSQNPAYGALFGQNPFVAAALNQTALNQAALNPASLATLNPLGGMGLGGYGGSPSGLGAYGAQGTTGSQGMQYGQSFLGRPPGSFGGQPSSYL